MGVTNGDTGRANCEEITRGSQRGESLQRGHTRPRAHACNRARTRWQFQQAVERGRWHADSQADGCPGSQTHGHKHDMPPAPELTETRGKMQGDLSSGRGPAIPQTRRTGFLNG